MKYKLYLKLVNGEDKFFGPGVARLLTLVGQHHSLHKAAAEMGMAYSKAWKMVKHVEAATGKPMLIRSRGGSEGGGSVLTEDAQQLIDAFRGFAKALCKQGDILFEEYFASFIVEEDHAGQ